VAEQLPFAAGLICYSDVLGFNCGPPPTLATRSQQILYLAAAADAKLPGASRSVQICLTNHRGHRGAQRNAGPPLRISCELCGCFQPLHSAALCPPARMRRLRGISDARGRAGERGVKADDFRNLPEIKVMLQSKANYGNAPRDAPGHYLSGPHCGRRQ
jgi:hypothetical protein